jgi:hypothetical protein
VVAADVEKSAQTTVIASHDQQGFSGNFTGDILPRRAQLIDASNQLP